ncbi:hypothetical protein KI387_028509 [Taxus chinensis]|uniref:FAF domain-containing protein n=1 Tax=Taxus chinensis TaxID=29808 RepID=A0AA38CGT8_TAXCH|nr:hypothetical protein KI387_028509 [Taxus chinensis]
MASLCNNSSQPFPKNEGDHRHEDEFVRGIDKLDRKSEGGDKSGEEFVDLWSLCEPGKRPLESLLGSNSLSAGLNTRPYGITETLVGNNSLCPRSNARPYGSSTGENLCGGKDGFHFCTESLGFESSDERDDCHAHFSSKAVEEEEPEEEPPGAYCFTEAAEKRLYATGHGHMGANKGTRFPPPLPSLAGTGKASVFLKPLRKDGRFLLQEVEVTRHELMHAWRQDGRLRLQLIARSESPPPDTSEDSPLGTDRSDTLERSDNCNVAKTAFPSSASGEGGQRGASLEDEHVQVESYRRGGGAGASLPILSSLARCQEKAACLRTWKPRYVAT